KDQQVRNPTFGFHPRCIEARRKREFEIPAFEELLEGPELDRDLPLCLLELPRAVEVDYPGGSVEPPFDLPNVQPDWFCLGLGAKAHLESPDGHAFEDHRRSCWLFLHGFARPVLSAGHHRLGPVRRSWLRAPRPLR